MQAADPASTAAGGTDRSVDLRSIEGVLIDMDGTLIDSDASVERTWRTWAEANGVDPELVAAVCHGATAEGTIRRFRPDLDDAAVDADASEHMRLESIDTEGVVALDGAVEFLATVEGFGLPWAVVTNADHGLATARLGAGGITPPVLTTVEEVPAGKPDPAIYRLGAQRIGVPIERCLVVEDSPAGIGAGVAAGAIVAALRRDEGHLRIEGLPELTRALRAART